MDPAAIDRADLAAEMAAYQYSDYADEPWETIHLDGRPLPAKGVVNYNNLATFAPKFTIGEPSKDSDNLFSVWVQDDWTGGGQVALLNALSDVQRFRAATAETRFPYMLTLPLKTYSFTIASEVGDAYPLGDYKPSGQPVLFWACFGLALRYWDVATQSFLGSASIAALPTQKAVVFNGYLWIPQGGSGYDTWDGTSVGHNGYSGSPHGGSAITPVSFLTWDDKLLALSTDGQVSIFDAISASWSSPPAIKLMNQATPRNLINWWDISGDPTVYIVTDSEVWAIDPIVPTLYRTGLKFPTHPDQGLGSCTWRDDAMYVSVATGVHQLARGNVVSAMGPDHNDGLPVDLRGAIVDLEPEYNSMLALVKGVGTVTVGADATMAEVVDIPQIADDSMVVPISKTTARSTLLRWTGTGWHTFWESSGSTGNPTRVMVSQANGEYRVWWGYGGSMLTQPLRRSFYTPRAGVQLGIDVFEPTAYMLTGRFDAGMAVFFKSGSHVEANFSEYSSGTIDIDYQTDINYPSWIHLGTMDASPGQRHLYFDPDGDGFSEGEQFRWIEFRYTLNSPDPAGTPIVRWIVLKFIKVPIQSLSWNLTVPLDKPEQWNGRGMLEIADDLDALASSGKFITFKHRMRTYRVRVTQVTGNDATGKDLRGVRTVSLLQLDETVTGGG